jgi:hypothetical protein
VNVFENLGVNVLVGVGAAERIIGQAKNKKKTIPENLIRPPNEFRVWLIN